MRASGKSALAAHLTQRVETFQSFFDRAGAFEADFRLTGHEQVVCHA
jgi:hypothetical protein